LESVNAAGLRDGETAQALAEIYSASDLTRASEFARQALAAENTSPPARAGALMVLALREMQERRFGEAAGLLEQLVRLRRDPGDWHMLGTCYLEQNQAGKALKALQYALAIRPSRPGIHAALAEVYRRVGDPQRADEHENKARWLTLHGQD
jgi:cytochrome c-type biogenesis protein CcmH/NrfG